MEALLIFPHQLYKNHPGLKKSRPVILIEEPRFFSDFAFHQQKLIFHRASMKNYEKDLKKRGYQTYYIEEKFEQVLKKLKISTLIFCQTDDHKLDKKLKSLKIELSVLPSPGFLTSIEEFQDLYKGKKNFRFESFYIYQRKKLDLLLDATGKPVGGKWSYDGENRKRVPKDLKIPKVKKFTKSSAVKEAIAYVTKKYPKNPGNPETFNYPTTHSLAKKSLTDFLETRFKFFGDYEDAIVQDEQLLFHSCLSPLLNVGLLTPDQVIEEAVEYAKKHHTPLNSLEGFIRQIIGWREYIRGIYHSIGEKQKKSNFFKHKRKLPKVFYSGKSGIAPLDQTIKKLHDHAYVHHIERLMILGNFFLLCEINPSEIYRWFMELFIDSYDWVMVPNVYGMSQYADGGIMTTKPYFSGSNYILKMSDYPKGSWSEVWDSLFWRFMIKHKKFFEKQPRLSLLCKTAKIKEKERSLLELGRNFLKELE